MTSDINKKYQIICLPLVLFELNELLINFTNILLLQPRALIISFQIKFIQLLIN